MGWTAACKLKAGDILVTLNGNLIVVVQHEILESPVTVYNFGYKVTKTKVGVFIVEELLGKEISNERFANVNIKGVDPDQSWYNVFTLGGIISW